MIVTKNVKLEGVGRVKRLSFAVLAVIMSVFFSAVYAAALSSSDLSESDKKAALAEAEHLWESRTSDDNITFRLTPEGILWTIAANQANGFNLYAEGIDKEIYSYIENEAIPVEEALASDKIPQFWKSKILEDLARIQKKSEEKAAAAGVQSAGGNSGFSGFTEEEKAKAIPVPRPEGIDAGANPEDASEESSSMPAKDKQEAAEAPQSGAESLGSGQDAAKAANSEIASVSSAAGAKEPEETMKDKSGEKKESFFVKVLKWLFGK